MTIVLAGIIVLITHALEAVTGFGCTVLALPFVTALLGLKEGILLLAVLGWMIALYFAVVKWRQIDFKQYLIIASLAALGMPLGMYLRDALPVSVLKKALAVFIVVAALIQIVKAMRKAEPAKESSLPLPFYTVFLVLGGIVHGIFASGGPLIVLYSARALPDKGAFRATLCLLWSTLNTILMVQFALEGRMNPAFALQLGIMLPFLAAGMIIGEIIHHRVDPLTFRRTVFAVLLAVGVIMLVSK